MGKPESGEITQLLHQVRDGDPDAFNRLLPLVYRELKQIARQQLGYRRATLCTTDLVHESYLKMVRQMPVDWEGRIHFYGVAARAMRQILVDYARKHSAAKRGGGAAPLTLTDRHVTFEIQIEELVALDDALNRLNKLSERLRRVVEFRFFGGMHEEEIAAILQVSTRTVERDWVKARLFLHRALYPDAAA